jgi:hypothetical protein
MPRKIEIVGDDVIVTEDNTVTAIRIDEESDLYQQLKAETNNFTENMNVPDTVETLEQTQSDLIYTLMMSGVI